MASRCINTLNDLDKISNRIHQKHSKRRFCADIEAKLKAARAKAERSLHEINIGPRCSSNKLINSNRQSLSLTSEAPSSRNLSLSEDTRTRTVTPEHHKKSVSKKVSKPSMSQSTLRAKRDLIQHRKIKSCPSCSLVNNGKKQSIDAVSDTVKVVRMGSVFGKFNGKGSEYRPVAWFNLPLETSIGAIDSLACEAKNVQPLCYSVDTKKGETISRLLQHNLEVRVGQNGIVRTEKKTDAEALEDDMGKDRQGKKRTTPLCWEELLHWQNACIVSVEPQKEENPLSKSLCETHPVIFHGRKSLQVEKQRRHSADTSHSPSYKLSLDSRWIFADRRDVLSSRNKYITSVEIEDCGDGDVARREKTCPFEGFLESGKKEDHRVAVSKTGGNVVKKVSFKDEKEVTEMLSLSVEGEKDTKKVKVGGRVIPVTPIVLKSNDIEVSSSMTSVPKVRPKTSTTYRERSRTYKNDFVDARKLERPLTAPPVSPSSRYTRNSSRHCNLIPIKIPTSKDEDKKNVLNTTNNSTDPDQSFTEFSESESPCLDSIVSGKESDVPKKQITFGTCKSAPIVRNSNQNEKRKLFRAKSSTGVERKKHPSASVVESTFSLELREEVPPARALTDLRKLIYDDLTQQNRELQLDIQRLYLKKHAE